METARIFAETFFYLTASAAVIAISIFGAIIMYHLIQIARELEELSRNLNHASREASERIHDMIDRLSALPLLSYFLKKHLGTREEKGRKKQFKK